MNTKINVEDRKPIWIALSDLYIDNELQYSDFKIVANAIRNSPYSLEEVKRIDRNEVFPILYTNLLSVAGVWTGFQEDWLVTKITNRIRKRTYVGRFFNKIIFLFFGHMNKEYWQQVENVLKTQLN